MGVGRASNGFKCCFYFLNAISCMTGLAVCGIGVWLLLDQSTLDYVTRFLDDMDGLEQKTLNHVIQFLTKLDGLGTETDKLKIVAYMFISVGGSVFVFGLVGCCGAVCEMSGVLGLYIFFLVLVAIAEIGAGALTIIYRNELIDGVEKNAANYIRRNYNASSEADFGLHYIQYKWDCCGVNGHSDFHNSSYSKTAGEAVSRFCCKMKDGYVFDERSTDVRSLTQCMVEARTCVIDGCLGTHSEVHREGCKSTIEDWIKGNLLIFIAIGIGIGCFEISVIVIAIIVHRQFASKK